MLLVASDCHVLQHLCISHGQSCTCPSRCIRLRRLTIMHCRSVLCRYRLGLSVTSSLPAVVACTLRADLCCSHMIGTLESHLGLLCRLRLVTVCCFAFSLWVYAASLGLNLHINASFVWLLELQHSGVVVQLPVALYRFIKCHIICRCRHVY